MPLTTPSGGITLAEHALAVTLANCAEWQAQTGGSAAAALAHCYFDALPPPLGNTYTKQELVELRPYALIYTDEQVGGYRLSCVGDPNAFDDSGSLAIRFEFNTPERLANDPQQLGRWFKNAIGKVLRSFDPNNPGLAELAGQAPDDDHVYLTIREMQLYGPFRAEPKDALVQGDFVYAFLFVDWGVR